MSTENNVSDQIRAEIENLKARGIDFSDAKVYTPELKAIQKKYNVSYALVKKIFNQFRIIPDMSSETPAQPSPTEPAKPSGSETVEISNAPKQPIPGVGTDAKSVTPPPKQEGSTYLTAEEGRQMIAGTLAGLLELEYMALEKAYDIKVTHRATAEAKEQAATTIAKALGDEGFRMPRYLMAAPVVAQVVPLFLVPFLEARDLAAQRKKEKEEEARNRRVQSAPPQAKPQGAVGQ